MKNKTMIEFAVISALVCVPVYAQIVSCGVVNVYDEGGNITGTDQACNTTEVKVVNSTVTWGSIKSRLQYLKNERPSAVGEKTRDTARNNAIIDAIDAEITALRSKRDELRAAGMNLSADDRNL